MTTRPADDPPSTDDPSSDPTLLALAADAGSTEARHPATERLDQLSPHELVEVFHQLDREVADAVHAAGPGIATAIERIAAGMGRGGRLLYFGAGTSGRLGILDAVECRPTFQAQDGQVEGRIAGGDQAFLRAVEGAEDSPEEGAKDVRELQVGPDDAVVGIAASGRTPYVLGALDEARARGAFTAAVVCNRATPAAARAEVAIEVLTGPELVSGSTRLKAGTATKMVLNMLSTGAFVRLGKVFGNLMVDVMATNHKLVERSRRIVAAAGGVDPVLARDLLEAADGEVKTAIVMARTGLEVAAARERLAAVDGRVRAALEG